MTWKVIPKWNLDEIYKATFYATKENIINALIAAKTMPGANGTKMYDWPENRLIQILKQLNKRTTSTHNA